MSLSSSPFLPAMKKPHFFRFISHTFIIFLKGMRGELRSSPNYSSALRVYLTTIAITNLNIMPGLQGLFVMQDGGLRYASLRRSDYVAILKRMGSGPRWNLERKEPITRLCEILIGTPLCKCSSWCFVVPHECFCSATMRSGAETCSS